MAYIIIGFVDLSGLKMKSLHICRAFTNELFVKTFSEIDISI